MNEPKPNEIQIPSEYHSMETEMPFQNCIECETYLLDGKSDYFIEKAIKKYEGFTARDVIFEYAICIHCAERMKQSLSKESMATLENYFAQNIDMIERFNLINSESTNHKEWTATCMITGKPSTDFSEYQIFAHCRGDKMILGQMPYLVSGEALEEVSELLSDETKDELDDFGKRHFGPPPELEEELPFKRVLII